MLSFKPKYTLPLTQVGLYAPVLLGCTRSTSAAIPHAKSRKVCQVESLSSRKSVKSKVYQVESLSSRKSVKSKVCQVESLSSRKSVKSKVCQVESLSSHKVYQVIKSIKSKVYQVESLSSRKSVKSKASLARDSVSCLLFYRL
jgi:hypothetical protein